MSSKIIEGSYHIRVVRCDVCHRKRRCRVIEDETTAYWSCSKGHLWQKKLPSISRLGNLLKDIYQEAITAAINNPSPFIKVLK
jgi:hypothetical protein